ncbi:hypothetical protein CVIRNUC_001728 [Coccomyxa viridis]|uniref:N-acetyltransferase domain-containing protein n=1 Tax=Coccomyxa viridis TaxID=1274662 RepID=A0AAV1HYC6_9CHLO|nr:hypothetical protein CVIRNUC_001728 [Coccomyxa viridis]
MRPYLRQFVEKYHTWMEDPVLRELTASEPLTLEAGGVHYAGELGQRREEYESSINDATNNSDAGLMLTCIRKCTFILFDRSLPSGLQSMPFALEKHHIIMIAEPGSRRKGIAKEALQLMMSHGHSQLGIERFVAKIAVDNSPSRHLFEALGFQESHYSKLPIGSSL